MGRPTTGPRRNSKNNPTLYAFLKHSEKIYKESLRTTDKGVALDRYPAAMRRLKLKAQGIKPVELFKPTDPAIDWQFTKQPAVVTLIYPHHQAVNTRSAATPSTKKTHSYKGHQKDESLGKRYQLRNT